MTISLVWIKTSSELVWGNQETYFIDGTTEVCGALWKEVWSENQVEAKSSLNSAPELSGLQTHLPADVQRGRPLDIFCGSYMFTPCCGSSGVSTLNQPFLLDERLLITIRFCILYFWNYCGMFFFVISNHHLLLEVNPKDLVHVQWKSVSMPGRNCSITQSSPGAPAYHFHLPLFHEEGSHRRDSEKG